MGHWCGDDNEKAKKCIGILSSQILGLGNKFVLGKFDVHFFKGTVYLDIGGAL